VNPGIKILTHAHVIERRDAARAPREGARVCASASVLLQAGFRTTAHAAAAIANCSYKRVLTYAHAHAHLAAAVARGWPPSAATSCRSGASSGAAFGAEVSEAQLSRTQDAGPRYAHS
jgi:hypothetical protein